MLSHYFGYSDANDDKDLHKYFYHSPLFDQLKKGDRDTGKFIIYGIKGGGKSAICKMVQAENKSKLVCKIDKSFGFDVRKLDDYSSPIESLMLTLLLKELINHIKAREREFSNPESVKEVNALAGRLKSFFKRVLSGTKLTAGLLELDLQKILSEDVSAFARFRIDEYQRGLTPALEEKQGYILIDDVDDVFIGADKNAAFVEGLVRAAKEINRSFGKNLHCIVFLKSGLFKLLFERAKEYDKLRDFVASISWGKEELVELLAERIKNKYSTQELIHWKLWQCDFEGIDQKSIDRIQDYIITRCVSGPRDLIVYCNMAKEAAGSGRVGLNHVENVEDRYSKEKLFEIGRDFSGTYPQISDFLQQVFTAAKQIYSNEQLMSMLSGKIVANEKIHGLFDHHDYVRFATKENLLELLYGIGFLGFRRSKTSEVEFVLTNPDPGSKVLYTAVEYRIHPAYEQYLNLAG